MNALKLWNIQDDPESLMTFIIDLSNQFLNDKITVEEFDKYSDVAHYYLIKCTLQTRANDLYKKYGIRL